MVVASRHLHRHLPNHMPTPTQSNEPARGEAAAEQKGEDVRNAVVATALLLAVVTAVARCVRCALLSCVHGAFRSVVDWRGCRHFKSRTLGIHRRLGGRAAVLSMMGLDMLKDADLAVRHFL